MVVPRFDGAAHWAALTADEQAEIGAAALEYAAANYATGELASSIRLTPLGRAAQEAWDKAADAILEAVVEALPRKAFYDQAGRPLIPSVLGPYCRACGCSQDDACPQGWSPEAEAEWRETLILTYGVGADEELYCVPSQGGGVVLARVLVEARTRASRPGA